MLSSIYTTQKPDYSKCQYIPKQNVLFTPLNTSNMIRLRQKENKENKENKDKSFVINTMNEPSLNYVAIIESEEVIHKDSDVSSETADTINHRFLYNKSKIYPTPTLANSHEDSNVDPFSLGKDPIKTFYIGSVTVVGLYILYKILHR